MTLTNTAPRFFVPHAEDDAQAERVWESTRQFMLEQGYTVLDRRIYSVTYTHNGKRCHDVVGQRSAAVPEDTLVILDAGSVFLCCTANRGVLRGGPIMAGKHWDTTAQEFGRGTD